MPKAPLAGRLQACLVANSVELEHLFEQLCNRVLSFLCGGGIVAGVRAVHDAGILVAEWLPGVGVDENSVGA